VLEVACNSKYSFLEIKRFREEQATSHEKKMVGGNRREIPEVDATGLPGSTRTWRD
jgi:hypothetical protein